MDLLSACWMIRSLDQAVSSISLDSDNNLIAGGWDGQIKKWDSDGDLQWVQNLPDRISEIVFHNKKIIVASGLHIVCLNSDSGAVEWQKPLEGSADSLLVKNEQIYATSSVYDIEHNDYHRVENFDFIGRRHSGSVFLGENLFTFGGAQPEGYNENEDYTTLNSVQFGYMDYDEVDEPNVCELVDCNNLHFVHHNREFFCFVPITYQPQLNHLPQHF